MAWGICKTMFTFVEIPAWPPFCIYKTAAMKYKFGHISASDHTIFFFKYANSKFSGAMNLMKVLNKCYGEE